jgi:hypothetical protein
MSMALNAMQYSVQCMCRIIVCAQGSLRDKHGTSHLKPAQISFPQETTT